MIEVRWWRKTAKAKPVLQQRNYEMGPIGLGPDPSGCCTIPVIGKIPIGKWEDVPTEGKP